MIDKLKQYNKQFADTDIEAIIGEIEKECEKIYKNCNYTCTMQQDMELIKREANEGYEPYKKVVRAHELQLKHCPKICPKYKEV